MPDSTDFNDYDSIPIQYCSKCYSLKVIHDESMGLDYCNDCGCTDIAESSIDEWEKAYVGRYKKKFLDASKDPYKSVIFNMTLKDLKKAIYECPTYKEIIYALYPKFPPGYSKEDSIFLFFDKLAKDNRVNALRLFLTKDYKGKRLKVNFIKN